MPQTQIYTAVAQGIPGSKAALGNQYAYYPNTLAASDDTIKVGAFVWLNATSPEALADSKGTGAPVGFVERNQIYYNEAVIGEDAKGTLAVPEGSVLTVATKGDFWATSTTAATVGQKVLVTNADGKISTGASAGSGQTDTGWVVATAGAAGDPIIISKH